MGNNLITVGSGIPTTIGEIVDGAVEAKTEVDYVYAGIDKKEHFRLDIISE